MLTSLFIISAAILIGFLMLPLAKRLGAPLLLLLLAVGMLLGDAGPGGIAFDDFQLAFDTGSIALAIILFAGGLETDRHVFKTAGAPAIALATIGVLVTAGIVGFAAHLLLSMSLLMALLLGAVVASTDAAATFMLIQQSGIALAERVKQTLLLESGLNDPVAIFLTIMLTAMVGASDALDLSAALPFLVLLFKQVTFGLLGGLVGGRLLVWLLNWLDLPAGTYAAVSIAGGLTIFSGISLLDGSGFLAIYLVGLMVRNYLDRPLDRIINFSEGLQWLSQIILFIMLGLLVSPSELQAELWPGLCIAGILIFVARPLAVKASVGFMGFRWQEEAFLSWVGLRGAVPILLAMYPVVDPGPVSTDFFNVVFIVVASSLLLQGWTIAPFGRKLGLDTSAKP